MTMIGPDGCFGIGGVGVTTTTGGGQVPSVSQIEPGCLLITTGGGQVPNCLHIDIGDLLKITVFAEAPVVSVPKVTASVAAKIMDLVIMIVS